MRSTRTMKAILRAANFIARLLPIISNLKWRQQCHRLNRRSEDTTRLKRFTGRIISNIRVGNGRSKGSDCTIKEAAPQTRSWPLVNTGKRKEH